ncbi:hypothetical protein HWV00_21320 (plasmid) [Moritella sp. 24]|uniref:hypothetical protein n=1 Tax=Moritella sp. 24 TaxID=2746230 RepID=UPI001BAE439C|nr:hypothetical protein [Moritella sp. 24]QUM78816.1 hypothetical protein HWV00_21320 [Moritella sp. 24]
MNLKKIILSMGILILPLSSYAIDELDIYCKGKMIMGKYGNHYILDRRFTINKNNPNEIKESQGNEIYGITYNIDGYKKEKDSATIHYGRVDPSFTKKRTISDIKTLNLSSLNNNTVYVIYTSARLKAYDNKMNGKQILEKAETYYVQCKNQLK